MCGGWGRGTSTVRLTPSVCYQDYLLLKISFRVFPPGPPHTHTRARTHTRTHTHPPTVRTTNVNVHPPWTNRSNPSTVNSVQNTFHSPAPNVHRLPSYRVPSFIVYVSGAPSHTYNSTSLSTLQPHNLTSLLPLTPPLRLGYPRGPVTLL